jgi:hypothetical protein
MDYKSRKKSMTPSKTRKKEETFPTPFSSPQTGTTLA